MVYDEALYEELWWVFLVIYQFPTCPTSWHILSQTLDCGTPRTGACCKDLLSVTFLQPSFLFLSERISSKRNLCFGIFSKMFFWRFNFNINSIWMVPTDVVSLFDFIVSSHWRTFRGALVFQPFQEDNVKSVSDSGHHLLWVSTGSENVKKQEIWCVLLSLGQEIGKWV